MSNEIKPEKLLRLKAGYNQHTALTSLYPALSRKGKETEYSEEPTNFFMGETEGISQWNKPNNQNTNTKNPNGKQVLKLIDISKLKKGAFYLPPNLKLASNTPQNERLFSKD